MANKQFMNGANEDSLATYIYNPIYLTSFDYDYMLQYSFHDASFKKDKK